MSTVVVLGLAVILYVWGEAIRRRADKTKADLDRLSKLLARMVVDQKVVDDMRTANRENIDALKRYAA